MNLIRKIGYLVLEDGSSFAGHFFGAVREIAGEVVFNTSMSGYQEILTDPSYYRQIVTMTYPEIGNYGIMEGESESDRIQASAFIVRHYVHNYSNAHAKSSLDTFLKESNVPGLSGIDTRKLTLKLRNQGAMRGGVFFQVEGARERLLKEVPDMSGWNLADEVSTKQSYSFGSPGPDRIKLAIIDFGIKQSMLHLLSNNGFYGTVFPSLTSFAEIMQGGFQAIFFSNGPGDPAPVQNGRKIAIQAIDNKIPSFGICLGHQILGLALGAKSFKLKFGHRGGNQPVINQENNKVEITAQNHGFALDYDSFSQLSEVEVTHLNLNDRTVEGMRHPKKGILSVQYHPESAPGPHDARYLFEEFRIMVRKFNQSAKH